MKIYLGVAMTAALLLTACAEPKPTAPATANAAAADQIQTASAAPAKKKCSNQTGSRLAPCGDGSTGDSVQGSSGDSYRDASMHSAPIKTPN